MLSKDIERKPFRTYVRYTTYLTYVRTGVILYALILNGGGIKISQKSTYQSYCGLTTIPFTGRSYPQYTFKMCPDDIFVVILEFPIGSPYHMFMIFQIVRFYFTWASGSGGARIGSVRRPSVRNFKWFLLWNSWAAWNQISGVASRTHGNENMFKRSWQHGRHANI